VFNAVQWLALLAAVAGLGWLGVLAGLGYLQLPVPETPRVQGWPLPTLLILGGAVLGIFLALTGRVIAAAAARLRARSAGKRLRAGVDKVASRHIVEPVQRQVDRLDSFAAALKKALGK
jgi:H+/Cl- antiporter ClcA